MMNNIDKIHYFKNICGGQVVKFLEGLNFELKIDIHINKPLVVVI